MPAITISHKGDLSKTFRFLRKLKSKKFYDALNRYGQMGVDALKDATPKDTGLASESWDYDVEISFSEASIVWTNSDENKGQRIVVLIQYGHGTRNGGYVVPNDFINPTMQPIFEKIANEVWAEVISDE